MTGPTPTLPDELAYPRLRALVAERFGIVIPTERDEAVRTGLLGSCSRLGLRDLGELFARLDAHDGAAMEGLLAQVTVNHTGFLRDTAAYDIFLREALPTFEGPERRIWSAAASTGEELYTLVILLAERFGVDELRHRWRFLGTDINPEAVRRAEAGRYDKERVAVWPAAQRERWFRPIGAGQFELDPTLRELCTFRQLNLVDAPLPFRGRFDAVFCRNVLYYFNEARQREVLGSIHAVTRPGGWLLTSATEAIEHLGTPWRRHDIIAYRKAVQP